MSIALYVIGFLIKLFFFFYTIIFLGDIFQIVLDYDAYKKLNQEGAIALALVLLIKIVVITFILMAFYAVSFIRNRFYKVKNKFTPLEFIILLIIAFLSILGRT